MTIPNAPGRDAPRRCYIDLLTPAEAAIRDAVLAVETAGADVRLTNAVVLLNSAQTCVADFVDGLEAQSRPGFEERDDAEWAIVEVFGHRRHAGRIREEERFGAKMLRIDVPKGGTLADGFTTHFYGGGSIFSLTMSDEATVLRMNRPYEPPSRLSYVEEVDDEQDDEAA